MIRINLLGVERQKARKATFSFNLAQGVPVLCGLIVVAAAAGIGWWYWSLTQASAQVDADIVATRQESARLAGLMNEVTQFEAQRTQLQQRVTLIETLRKGQSIPVQLLDHVSKSLPDMLWLTDLEQEGPGLTIEGRATTLIALSDFVGNLGLGATLTKPIEIVKSEVAEVGTTPGQPGAELIQFTVRAQVAGVRPVEPAKPGR
jgi:type IV pilus assembly protein PilN